MVQNILGFGLYIHSTLNFFTVKLNENRPEKLLGQLCLKVGKSLAMHFADKNDKIFKEHFHNFPSK